MKDTLNDKQNILIAGNNITIDGDTISSSGGGETTQEQSDSIAKLALANTFTANQTISGNLSAINATFTGATTCTNLTASNGSIYTFSADTGEFVGLNTEMIWGEEAEIERLVVTPYTNLARRIN